MFIGFGTLLLFAVCYVVAESWLEIAAAAPPDFPSP
jgi:hypothetical protein